MSEIIEYKSNGHPDTLTDLIAEDCATLLDRYYLEKYQRILHYNVDKALFSAGDVEIHYGGGAVHRSPVFMLGGQASNLDDELKLLLIQQVMSTSRRILPNLGAMGVEIRTSNISKNLKDIAGDGSVLANDTSFGVGYYPFSLREETVFAIRDEIDAMIHEHAIPIGEDYKIMLTPQTICVSAPLYAAKVHSKGEYAAYKYAIEDVLSQYGKVIFNPDFNGGFPYMTLCGSSIECGDDGQVGRGNRYNGLITPCRPMTIEAYCGKNNRNHVGKLYQKLAFEKAKELYGQTGKYHEVILVSKIGKPIDEYEIYIREDTNVKTKKVQER